VRLDRLREVRPRPPDVVRDDGEAFVDLPAQAVDLPRAGGHLLLLPPVGHGLEKRDERRGGGENHLAEAAVLDEARVVLDGGAEEGLAGQVHDHELGRLLELVPVGLGPQPVHVGAHGRHVSREGLLAVLLAGGLQGIEESVHGRLGVDDDDPAVGQPHDHVGPELSGFRVHRDLLVEIAPGRHTGQLGRAPQRHLSPGAAHLGLAKGRGQTGRFPLQGLVHGAEGLDLPGEIPGLLGPDPLHLPQLLLVALQGLLERPDRPLEPCLVLAELPLRLLEDPAEVFRGELQETAVAAFEGGRCLGPEGVGHLRPHRLDDSPLPFDAAGGLVQPGLGLHGLDPLVVESLAQPGDLALRQIELAPQLVHLPLGVTRPAFQLRDPRGEAPPDLVDLIENFLLRGQPRDDPQQDPAGSEAGREDDHEVDGHGASGRWQMAKGKRKKAWLRRLPLSLFPVPDAHLLSLSPQLGKGFGIRSPAPGTGSHGGHEPRIRIVAARCGIAKHAAEPARRPCSVCRKGLLQRLWDTEGGKCCG